MSWKYRDIQTFPAVYSEVMRNAVANLNSPRLLFTHGDENSRLRDTEHFRHFRWCLRQRPEINSVLSTYELTYQFRLATDDIDDRLLTYLTARPSNVSDLLSSNPDLADLILTECQR